MDFQKFKGGIHFFYILPFSSKKGLFETTYFSTKILNDSIYKSDIRKYLKRKFPNQKYKIKFVEKGVIPMFHFDNLSKYSFPIGTSGNWVRPSTGYAFQNSFINAKKIVDSLLKNKKPNIYIDKKINFLDRIFCYYITNYSSDSKTFFKCFFYKNKFKDIISFLIGDINFFKMLSIIISLPKKNLIYSMFKTFKNN